MVNKKPKKIFELYRIANKLKMSDDVEEFRGGIVKEIGANNYLVLKSLVCFINKENTCFPSISTICSMLGFSANTVNKALKELEEMGFIKKELVKLPNVRAKHNVYTILVSTETSQEEKENKSDVDRLYDYFKTKFRERYDKEYVSDYGIDSDMNFLEKLLADCGDNFDYACAIVAKHIDSYLGKKGYETPNIYFLYKNRLTTMKKKVDKDLELQRRIENPPKPKGRLKNFASEDYNPNDDMDKIEDLDSDEFEKLFTDDDKRKWEIANF